MLCKLPICFLCVNHTDGKKAIDPVLIGILVATYVCFIDLFKCYIG